MQLNHVTYKWLNTKGTFFKYVKGCHMSELDLVLYNPKWQKEGPQMKVIGRKITASQLNRMAYQR